MQETYENIPGQSKITFLLQAIRNTAAAEEVCLNLWVLQFFKGTWRRRRREDIHGGHVGVNEQVWH